MAKAKRFVYVIRTVGHPPRYYTGITSDVANGLADHNAGHSPHTARHRPWRIHVVILFPDESRAAAFERYLKSGSGRAFAREHFEQADGT